MSGPVCYLDPGQLQRDLGMRDLSDRAEGPHAIQILIGQAVQGLARAWDCEVRWCRGPRIVPVADNYDRLGYPAEAITREARYTRYVDAGRPARGVPASDQKPKETRARSPFGATSAWRGMIVNAPGRPFGPVPTDRGLRPPPGSALGCLGLAGAGGDGDPALDHLAHDQGNRRHAGHLDTARELLDGRSGLG